MADETPPPSCSVCGHNHEGLDHAAAIEAAHEAAEHNAPASKRKGSK